MNYIHIDPLERGLAAWVRDWPYSSFDHMVKLGVYSEDWAADVSNDGGGFRRAAVTARSEVMGFAKSSTHPARCHRAGPTGTH
jgi:hypothetical protein